MSQKTNKNRGVKKASLAAISCYILLFSYSALSHTNESLKSSQAIDIIGVWCPEPDLNWHARFTEAQDFKSCIKTRLKYFDLIRKTEINFSKRRQKGVSRRITLRIVATTSTSKITTKFGGSYGIHRSKNS